MTRRMVGPSRYLTIFYIVSIVHARADAAEVAQNSTSGRRYLEIADFELALLQIVDREHKANEARLTRIESRKSM